MVSYNCYVVIELGHCQMIVMVIVLNYTLKDYPEGVQFTKSFAKLLQNKNEHLVPIAN